jgi:hypothetical protein
MIGDDRKKVFLSAKALQWCTCGQTHHRVSSLKAPAGRIAQGAAIPRRLAEQPLAVERKQSPTKP